MASSLHLFPRKQAMCLHREVHYPLWTKRCLQSSIILKLLPLLLQISGSQGKHPFLSPLADFEHFANFFVLFLWCSAKISTSRSFSNDTQWHLRLMMASFCYQLYWITEFSGNIESMTLALATRVFLEAIVLWVLRHDDSIKYLMGSPEIYILFYNF